MSTHVHKPAANPFASYAFQEIEENEDEQEDDEEQDEWSDEEYLHSDDDDDDDSEFEVEFEDDYSDDQFDDDYDCDTEDGDDDDHEYLDEEEDSHYKNNYTPGPGYFYPEQPYVGPPIVPKPSPDTSSSKFSYYVLSPICDIATIYIKFAILAILIYACALWYTVYFGDLSSITDMDDDDADTCPAN